MTNVPCPRCGMLVGLDEEVCPHCRTPRDDMEMEEGRALVRNEELRRQRQPKLVAAGVAALAVLCLAWFMRERIAGSLSAAWQDFSAEVEKARDPRNLAASKKHFAPPETIFSSPAADQPQVAVSSFVYLNGAQPAAPAPAAPQDQSGHPPPKPAEFTPSGAPHASMKTFTPAPTPPSPGASYCRFYGTIYDLSSLKPLAGAQAVFKLKGQENGWTVTANDLGHYRLDLFKNIPANTLTVSASIPGYRPGLLEDKNPPLRDWSRASRKMVVEETSDLDLEPWPIRVNTNTDIVELDLIAVPLKKRRE